MKKYQVQIDLTADGEENIALLDSPLFDTEEEALAWDEANGYNYDNLERIMVIYGHDGSGKLYESYLLK